MFLCFKNRIQLLSLPQHSSHVLQPLDQSVFGPLKMAYRKELGFLSQWGDSTVVGKRNFLACYRKARQVSLTSQNIKSGWKSTGLWPVSVAKPLLSPLLLENSNQGASEADPSITPVIGSKSIPNWASDTSAVIWSTPRKAVQLRDQLGLFNKLEQPTTTQRLLFQKVSKAFQEKDTQLAVALRKIDSLEAQVEGGRVRKRKKVRLSPNSRFADVAAVYRAQVEAGESAVPLDEFSASDFSSEEGSCIVVASREVEQ